MNRKSLFSLLLAVVVLLSFSACDLTNLLDSLPPAPPKEDPVIPTKIPTKVPRASDPPIPTDEPIIPVNTDTPVPTITPIPPTETALTQYEAFEVGPDFWLTYDPQLWKVAKRGDLEYLESRSMETCQIKYQWGHGMDFQRFQPEIGQKQFGSKSFETKRWYPVDNPSETILYGYYSGSIYISIENRDASPFPDECIAQVDDVLRLSVDKNFR